MARVAGSSAHPLEPRSDRLAAQPDEARRLELAVRQRIVHHTWEETVAVLVQHVMAPGTPAAARAPLYAPLAAERPPSP
jgi:hypothetical protein